LLLTLLLQRHLDLKSVLPEAECVAPALAHVLVVDPFKIGCGSKIVLTIRDQLSFNLETTTLYLVVSQ